MSRSSLSQFPGANSQRGGRTFSSRESLLVPRQENDPVSDSESEFRRKLNSLWLKMPRGVLDGCSQPRNQRPHQNLLIS
jgi:hypothetical protein